MEDPEDRYGAGSQRRVVRLVVPGIAAAVAVGGTAFALAGTNDPQLQAVPAAATLPDRDSAGTSRSEERPLAATQTPSASAMPTATPSAGTPSAQPQKLGGSAFTPKPSPAPSLTAKASASATSKATTSSSPKATAAPTKAPTKAPAQATTKTTTAKATGSVANCPAPTGWLGPNAQKVYEASCINFPYVSAYGGARPGDPGEHGTGNAIDIMISGDRGLAIAAYMRANASRLGVTEVIYQQKIWTVQRSSEGWRPMSDRGSTTANHYDHVHVSVS
ncbi:hypothetical protein GA0111570_102427 [Raineyella antarctica]|uniref:ARB-07466-like C-terminal domain-containing protein n=2 Tax=Raineyella antarctica TaxID=1577474 RepID=A0A1G6GHH8_9ACTN|nr:hypothetical protein GA0111570_102427 [Raineyella antarctica]